MHDTIFFTNKNMLSPIALGFTILIACTGLYEAEIMPKDEYLISALILILLLTGYNQNYNFKFIEKNILIGFIIFNTYFGARLYLSQPAVTELKIYFTHFISLGIFISTYSISKLALNTDATSSYIPKIKFIPVLCIITLSIMLLSQIWDLSNSPKGLFSRPGGFLNPNITAAIALIFTFIIFKLFKTDNFYLLLSSILLTTSIVLLAQSRSAFLVLIPFFIYMSVKIKHKNFIILTFCVLLILLLLDFFSTSLNFSDLIERTFNRFVVEYKYYKSYNRSQLLQQGWAAFLDAPLWGNGYRYIASLAKHSTHNEILEILVNFGLTGLIIIAVASYFLYIPFSSAFFFVCITPTFLFTHNFFDTYAIQASLGLALAVDRSLKKPANLNNAYNISKHRY